MNKIEEIRKACIKANPVDLGKGICMNCDKSFCTCDNRTHNPKDGMVAPRPIRLADVLLTIDTKGRPDVSVAAHGEFISWNGDSAPDAMVETMDAYWNLKEDLENQSPECIDFIHGLLTSTPPNRDK